MAMWKGVRMMSLFAAGTSRQAHDPEALDEASSCQGCHRLEESCQNAKKVRTAGIENNQKMDAAGHSFSF
jgi:hypothetical protein